jgi:putative hydrolase of the HAD superfamily
MTRVVLWDFDGTLAERPGMWGACMLEVLDEHERGHGVTHEALRPLLRDGFPWHAPTVAHPELCEAEAWWRHVAGLLARAYANLGYSAERSAGLAQLARARYVDVAAGWSVFDDTVPALTRLRGRGWRHVLLSNHVPELPSLVQALGLASYFEAVLTSALTGYEKPHPEAYALALRTAGPCEEVWMVGDNYEADFAGAEAAGVPAILARRHDPRAARSVVDLDELERFIP